MSDNDLEKSGDTGMGNGTEQVDQLHKLADRIADGLFQCDQDGIIRYLSLNGASLLGFESPDQIVGKHDLKLFFQNEEDHYRFYKRLESAVDIYDFQVRFKPENHWEKFLSINCHKLISDDGALFGYGGTIRNVTKQAKMLKTIEEYANHLEKNLKQQGKRLSEDVTQQQIIFNSVPSGIIILDTNLLVERMNSVAQAWFGSPGDYYTTFWNEKNKDKSKTDLENLIKKTLDSGISYTEDLKLKLVNDEEKLFTIRTNSIRDNLECLKGVLVIVDEAQQQEDSPEPKPAKSHAKRTSQLEKINQRLIQHSGDLEKMVEEQTRDLIYERDIFQSIVSSLGTAVILTDVNGVVQKANRKAEQYLDKPAGKIVGNPLKNFCMLEDPNEIDELLRRYAFENETKSFLDDIEYFGHWYQASFSRAENRSGEFIGVLVNIQDIHDRKLMEQQYLASTQDMETANEELADTKDRIEEQAAHLNMAFEDLKQADVKIKEQNEKMLKDLGSARCIQQALLPRNIAEGPGFQFSYHYHPCESVGGDFFDIFPINKDKVAFYLADVSGHGVSAAMLAVFAKQAMKTIESLGLDIILEPGKVLCRLNEEVIDAAFEDMPFLTICYGVLDTRTMHLRFSAAAHPAPVVINTLTKELRTLKYEDSSPLGWFKEDEYACAEYYLKKGDRLLLQTDGVTEIFTPDEVMMDEEDYNKQLLEMAGKNIEDFGNSIFKLVEDFTQKTVQDDDITLIILDCIEDPVQDADDDTQSNYEIEESAFVPPEADSEFV